MAESHKLPVTIEDEMRRSYLDYAMSVIIGRAIPDVRDGLKPVHRRILYSMHEQKVHFNQSYRKSARIVGDVLGKYHPHGDSAVYDALVRMAQDFAMRYPLVDGQGNFGSVDGDPPAAMRYTEVRMARIASELLADIEKDTVDFGPNFDDSEREPLVLPSRVPNLLINGSGGIAVGMATNIPPHNLSEIVDATIRLIENPDLTVDELLVGDPVTGRLGVTGPDFPTAGFIYGTSGIVQAYKTGRGRIVMRARARIEEMPGKNDRERIIVTEIPYQVNKAELLKKIADLVRDKRIEGISDLRDESDRDGMRMVIELKRDAHGEIVLNKLFQMTALQSTFGYNCLSIVGQRPELLDLRGCLRHFIQHRRDVVTRRTRFELAQALSQRELVEGLGMAVTEVDLVVRTIRESSDPEEARRRLQQLPLHGLEAFVRRAGRPESEIERAKERGEYRLSERQSKAILEMRLSRLTGLEREKLANEYGELCELIARLEAILAQEILMRKVIVDELQEIRERYGDERRTEVVEAEGDISIEDLIADEEVVVTLSHEGYIKRVPLSEYRSQGRGGKGQKAMNTRDEDFVSSVFVVNTHAHLLFLGESGKAYLKKVYQIPSSGRAARGRAVVNFVGMEQDDRVAAVLPIREFVEDGFLLTCTRKGRVKRTELSAYESIRQTGIIGVNIEEGDELLSARIVSSGQHVLLATSQGMTIRFQVDDVRAMGRDSRGVKGIDLREGDFVVGMDVIEDEEGQQVLSISSNGYGKRTPISEWRVQNRGGLGLIGIQVTEKTGELVRVRLVWADDHIMVITDGGKVIRTSVEEIRETKRSAQGVRVINVAEAERVVDVEPLAEDEEGERFSRMPSRAPDEEEIDGVEQAASSASAEPAGGSVEPEAPLEAPSEPEEASEGEPESGGEE
ncbi:MAG: DNA gyrase subunit A [Myxococcales bacterium]|nr:DNA gyrase subunit A [Myxococcales bacterium]